MKAFLTKVRAFSREEDGVALTEYLILLGLLVGGVVGTVIAAGNNLEAAWSSWGTFWTQTNYTPPAATPPAG